MDDQDHHDHQPYRDLWMDLRAVLVHRKFTIATVFIATVLAGYGALSVLTERYEAHGRLLVKLGRENAEVPLTVEAPVSPEAVTVML